MGDGSQDGGAVSGTVALVERKHLGGTCVNTGCMPTKALVASARAAHVIRRAASYGIDVAGPIAVDMARVKARAKAVTMSSRTGLETWLAGTKGVTVIHGHARFLSKDALQVGEETMAAKRIFINVGARALVPKIPGLDDVAYLTNASIIELETLPKHLVVIGGGPIGLEFAQMYRRFGSEVTIIEAGARLLEREDEEVSAAVNGVLEGEGIHVRVGVRTVAAQREADGVKVTLSSGDAVLGSHLLVATGRKPNTDDLDLEKAGVNVDPRGHITVDDQLRTDVEGIWALGEVNGRGNFTHTAYNDFEIVAANVLDDEPRKITDRIDAYAIYMDPPFARIGISEAAARKSNRRYLVGHRAMTRVGRAVEKGETHGFMKVLVDAETKRIAGATIFGTDGDEAIHALLYAMYAGATAETTTHSVGIHPTVSELLPTLLGDLRPLT